MLCRPLRSPRSASRRLPGGTRRLAHSVAACNCRSLRRATRSTFFQRATGRLWNRASVSRHANERIIGCHDIPYYGIRRSEQKTAPSSPHGAPYLPGAGRAVWCRFVAWGIARVGNRTPRRSRRGRARARDEAGSPHLGDQLTVLECRPVELECRADLVGCKMLAKRRRRFLIKEHAHSRGLQGTAGVLEHEPGLLPGDLEKPFERFR